MNRREFFLKSLSATAAGLLVPEHLLKGRSMVSLCGVDLAGWQRATPVIDYDYLSLRILSSSSEAFTIGMKNLDGSEFSWVWKGTKKTWEKGEL